MTRSLVLVLAVVLAACASSPSPSSPPAATPAPTSPTPASPLSCDRDQDCTVFDDCGECRPATIRARPPATACSEVHGPGCGGFIPHCNVEAHTCELHAIAPNVES